MKRICAVLVFAAMALLGGCKSNSDVLVSYTGGRITRGEFYSWMRIHNIPEKSTLTSAKKQKRKLKQMLVERLTAEQAEKDGYQNSDQYKNLEKYLKKGFIAGYYQKKLRDSGAFSEDAVKLRIIKLRVKDYAVAKNKRHKLSDEELAQSFEQTEKKAAAIIAKLEKGSDFATVAKKSSNDYSKRKGGEIGYIVKGMREPELFDAAFSLNEGEISKKPVKTRRGVYIVKVEKKVKLTQDNILQTIDDQKQAERLKSRLQTNAMVDRIKKLEAAGDITNSIKTVNFADKNAVIYKVGKDEFKVSDLDSFVDLIEKMNKIPGRKNPNLDRKKKEMISERFFRQDVLMRDAEKNGIDQSKNYMDDWEAVKKSFLAGTYRNNKILTGIEITPEQVKQEYQREIKHVAERNAKRKPGSRMEKPKPFAKLKDRIEYMLYGKARSAKIKDYEDKLLKKVNFSINESKLDIRKPKSKSR